VINDILLYVGAGAITLWGIAHIASTKKVVAGFGSLSEDNKRIITMEWLAEGLTLCFIGLLVLLTTIFEDVQNPLSLIVYKMSALMLAIMAGWTLLTGAKTSILPIKVCPFVKTVVAILFLLGSAL